MFSATIRAYCMNIHYLLRQQKLHPRCVNLFESETSHEFISDFQNSNWNNFFLILKNERRRYRKLPTESNLSFNNFNAKIASIQRQCFASLWLAKQWSILHYAIHTHMQRFNYALYDTHRYCYVRGYIKMI